MYEKLLAIIALGLFAVFLGIIGYRVQEWDLRIVLLISFGLATYDFWLDAFSGKKNGNGNGKKNG